MRINTDLLRYPTEEIGRTLCLLAKARLAEQELDSIRAVLSRCDQPDWDLLHELAEINAIVPWYVTQVSNRLPEFIERIPENMIVTTDLVRTSAAKRNARAKELFQAFADASLNLVVLKGAMLGSLIYHDPCYKKMNDIDLLLHPDEVRRGLEIFAAQKLVSIGDLFGTYQPGSSTHHTPSFVSSDGAIITGIHFNLVSPYAEIKPDIEAIFSAKVRTTISGTPVYRMSWEDNLFHLCIHLPFYKTGLRELADIANLILATENFDWPTFAATVSNANASDPVYRNLILTDRLIPFGLSHDLLCHLEAKVSVYTRKDTLKRADNLEILLSSRSSYIAKIEKLFVVFKLSGDYREKLLCYLMIWKIALFPPRTELIKICNLAEKPSFPSLIYGYCRFPLLVWRALGRDHGKSALVVITVLNFLTMIKDTILLPLKKKGRSIKEHPHYELYKSLE